MFIFQAKCLCFTNLHVRLYVKALILIAKLRKIVVILALHVCVCVFKLTYVYCVRDTCFGNSVEIKFEHNKKIREVLLIEHS